MVEMGSRKERLPSFALQAMLVAILMPAVVYSMNLRSPTPAELLV